MISGLCSVGKSTPVLFVHMSTNHCYIIKKSLNEKTNNLYKAQISFFVCLFDKKPNPFPLRHDTAGIITVLNCDHLNSALPTISLGFDF